MVDIFLISRAPRIPFLLTRRYIARSYKQFPSVIIGNVIFKQLEKKTGFQMTISIVCPGKPWILIHPIINECFCFNIGKSDITTIKDSSQILVTAFIVLHQAVSLATSKLVKIWIANFWKIEGNHLEFLATVEDKMSLGHHKKWCI